MRVSRVWFSYSDDEEREKKRRGEISVTDRSRLYGDEKSWLASYLPTELRLRTRQLPETWRPDPYAGLIDIAHPRQ